MTPDLQHALVVLAWVVGSVVVLGAVCAVAVFLGIAALIREMFRQERKRYRR